MARIRTIKPDFWTDDKLTECSLSARLLFIGTWNFADDEGNLDRSAKQIKARVFPVDNIDCEPLLAELIEQKLLVEYVVDGKKYLHIQGFRKHQVINRPSAPACPVYEESMNAHATLTESSMSTHAGREGKEGKGKETQAPVGVSVPASPKKPNPKSDGFDARTAMIEKAGLDAGLVDDFLAVRKSHRAPVTRTALNGIVEQARKAGWTFEQAIKACCENNWRGFKAEWVEGKTPPASSVQPSETRDEMLARLRDEYGRMQEAWTVPVGCAGLPPVVLQ